MQGDVEDDDSIPPLSVNSSILNNTQYLSGIFDQMTLNGETAQPTDSKNPLLDFRVVDELLDDLKNVGIGPHDDLSKIAEKNDGTNLDLPSNFNPNDTNDGIEKILEDFQKDFVSDEDTSEKVFTSLICVYGIVIFFGLIGNLVILYAILSNKKMRTPRNYFIVNLAISDLLLCSMTMPLTLWEVLSRKWPFGENLEWLCQLAHSCQGTPVFLSSMAIVAIAVDRYRCIMQPDQPHFNSVAAVSISLVMTILSVLLTIPMFVTAEIKHFIEFPDAVNMANILICQDIWKGSSKIAYTVISSCAQYLFPVILVITLYLSIYLKLRNRPQSQHAENNEKRRRTNIMILCIAMVFFISWLPLNLFNIFMDLHPSLMKPIITGNETVIYAVLHLFGLCNALTNPILYGYLNENFRKEYKGIYRQMPWYSTSHVDNGLEVAVHCRVINRMNNNSTPTSDNIRILRTFRSNHHVPRRALVRIDNNNVSVVGPASIAQRLIFAAASAAAAVPRSLSGSNDLSDDNTAQAIANAFLKSVGETVNNADTDDTVQDIVNEGCKDENLDCPFSAKIFFEGNEVQGFFPISPKSIETATATLVFGNSYDTKDDLEARDLFDERNDESEVFLVAERPSIRRQKSSRRSSWVSRRLSSSSSQRQRCRDSRSSNSSEIAILSVNSFCQENGNNEGVSYKSDAQMLNFSNGQCQFSIPNVLMSATISHEAYNIDNAQLDDLHGMKTIPRGRLVSLVADKLHQRPVFAPFCHPVDLEGLQETAV